MRRRGDAVDGVLLLDKPAGISSNTALQHARRLLNAAKAGHTGTLDPMATGLLPLCFGEATKFSGLLLEARKTYLARVVLGVRTTTGDAEGEVLSSTSAAYLAHSHILDVLAGLVGELEQTPPMHSALKHRGKPLYEYARAGQEIERPSRRVNVFSLDVLRLECPEVDIRVQVSKGTYIRSLAMEAGERLGCGAHLGALRREAVASFRLEDAVSLQALQDMDLEGRRRQLAPPEILLADMPSVVLDARDAHAIRQGRPVAAAGASGMVRLYDAAGVFLGVGQAAQDGTLCAQRLLRTA